MKFKNLIFLFIILLPFSCKKVDQQLTAKNKLNIIKNDETSVNLRGGGCVLKANFPIPLNVVVTTATLNNNMLPCEFDNYSYFAGTSILEKYFEWEYFGHCNDEEREISTCEEIIVPLYFPCSKYFGGQTGYLWYYQMFTDSPPATSDTNDYPYYFNASGGSGSGLNAFNEENIHSMATYANSVVQQYTSGLNYDFLDVDFFQPPVGCSFVCDCETTWNPNTQVTTLVHPNVRTVYISIKYCTYGGDDDLG